MSMREQTMAESPSPVAARLEDCHLEQACLENARHEDALHEDAPHDSGGAPRDHAGTWVPLRTGSPAPAGWAPASTLARPGDPALWLKQKHTVARRGTRPESMRGSRESGSGASIAAGQRSQKQLQAVVVHSGARDSYQVARALEERGLLSCLVTDLWWPADRAWARSLGRLLPAGVRSMLAQRQAPGIGSRRVRALGLRGLFTLLLDKLPRVPFAWRRSVMRQTDAALGSYAGRCARQRSAVVLAYSYYGYHALTEAEAPGMLFQLHPHPASMRRILGAELALHPECAASLGREWELALPEPDFQRLVQETRMAAHTLVASSFTRDTLIEHGTPAATITVVPYGVDCVRFSPDFTHSSAPSSRQAGSPPLRLLFVGRINQRKGIKYLLEALRLLNQASQVNQANQVNRGEPGPAPAPALVELTICGRVVDDLALFAPFGAQVVIRPDVSHAELVEAYREADLFVFPSVGEGFGHVLLEALACGLPILSTTATAAPDLIEQGREGWVVEPGRPELLAERIGWAATHRAELAAMRPRARACAEQFTWARFRAGVAAAYERFVSRAPGLIEQAAPQAGEDAGACRVEQQEVERV